MHTANIDPGASRDDIRRSIRTHPDVFRQALRIRAVETRLLALYGEGKLSGTVHTCVGQELVGPAVQVHTGEADVFFSNHRGHGHFLARTGDVGGLLREIMGKETGVCGGMGGSQHLHADGFFSNGIQGGMAPIAAGMAYALKRRETGGIPIVFIGDGTLGEGALYEAFNVCAVHALPAVFVLENNGYAQSTPMSETFAGDVARRAAGFGLDYHAVDVWHPGAMIDGLGEALAHARAVSSPALVEVACYRLNAHSKGDDNRSSMEIARFHRIDPLMVALEMDDGPLAACVDAIEAELDELVHRIDEEPTLAVTPRMEWDAPGAHGGAMTDASPALETDTINIRIGHGLRTWLETDPNVFVIGEDVRDTSPETESTYGGAFKVTRGLSTAFDDRVLNFPISESALVGFGTGAALGGLRPVVEIMFGDFLTLGFDQLYQHAAKFRMMYGDRVRVPLIVRTPMGGKRGYGPTHSQSIEKFFVGIPGLRVVALHDRIAPEVVLAAASRSNDPLLMIENKILYTRTVRSTASPFTAHWSDDAFPTLRLSMGPHNPDLTLLCFGENLASAEEAAATAFVENEIICEIICPLQLNPLPTTELVESAGASRRLLTVEEGPVSAGIGAEALACLAEHGVALKRAVRMGFDGVIPASKQAELNSLPTVEGMLSAIRNVIGKGNDYLRAA